MPRTFTGQPALKSDQRASATAARKRQRREYFTTTVMAADRSVFVAELRRIADKFEAAR